MNKKLKTLVAAAMLLICSILYGLELTNPVSTVPGNPVTITVVPGMTAQQIGELLYNEGIIKNVFVFRLIARLDELETSLQAGEYAFTRDMSVQTIVKMLAKGETVYQQFTIPEGYTIDQIAALLAEKKLADAAKFKALAKEYAAYDYMAMSSGTVYRAEGFVFPDTYKIAKGTTEERILHILTEQFNAQFTPQMRQRALELGLSVREVVTLASLVEREAKLDKERPLVASVFLNRLKKGMPLQSCATIQYILGNPKAELTIKDTEIPSTYNTYQNMGLPPGPVASPGLASLRAVLYPADTDYLFFVVDGQGGHRFTKSYDEHLTAINQEGI